LGNKRRDNKIGWLKIFETYFYLTFVLKLSLYYYPNEIEYWHNNDKAKRDEDCLKEI